MDVKEAKDFIKDYIENIKPKLFEISDFVFANPETAFEEYKAYDTQVAFLNANGFKVTERAAGMDTGYVAVFSTGDGINVGLVSEYDALPGLGHACGHNLICAATMGAAAALKAAMVTHSVKGTLTVFGGPGEESGGGKIILLKNGAFDNTDVAMAVHPTSAMSRVAGENSAFSSFVIEYKGEKAHASARPWLGKNAFDAALLFFNALSYLRQQTRDGVRMYEKSVDGLSGTGGTLCDYVKIQYEICAPTIMGVEEVARRFRGCIQAGAVGTGCEVVYEEQVGYKNRVPNKVLGDVFRANCIELGEPMMEGMPADSGGEDMGDVSHFIPAINPHMTIYPGSKISSHTAFFRDVVRDSPASKDFIILNAKAMAMTGLDMLLYPDKVEEAKAELTGRLIELYGDAYESYRK